MSTTLTAEFRPLTVPASVDAPDAADFVEMIRVRNAVYQEISGNDDDDVTAAEILPHFGSDEDNENVAWIVVVDGEIVGRVLVDFPQEDGSRVGFWNVELLQKVHGHGIGTEGFHLVEQAARERGRTVLQTWARHIETDGPRLEAPTGYGTVPHDRVARYLTRHGHTLEQIERKSVLPLAGSEEHVDALFNEAVAASNGYEVLQWLAPTPPEHRDHFAWLKSRMSTDAPSAEMEFDEEAWDSARVARAEAKLSEGGLTMLITVARHIETGTLVAFNELVLPTDPTRPTDQWDTLVLKEHRGHKLGLLVKTAGLRKWREIAPESPKVITYNAEENRPMLDINEYIGFAPDAYNGAWKSTLS